MKPTTHLKSMIVALALSSTPALAGSWQVTYTQSGSGTYGSSSDAWPTSPSTTMSQSEAEGRVYRHGYLLSGQGASEAGTVTAVVTWQPSFQGDIPPQATNGNTLFATETSSATSLVAFSVVGNPVPGITVNSSDGLGDTSVNSNNAVNQPTYGQAVSSGTHSISAPVTLNAGVYTATLPARSLSAYASYSSSGNDHPASHVASVAYSAQVDTGYWTGPLYRQTDGTYNTIDPTTETISTVSWPQNANGNTCECKDPAPGQWSRTFMTQATVVPVFYWQHGSGGQPLLKTIHVTVDCNAEVDNKNPANFENYAVDDGFTDSLWGFTDPAVGSASGLRSHGTHTLVIPVTSHDVPNVGQVGWEADVPSIELLARVENSTGDLNAPYDYVLTVSVSASIPN